jgi:hypothetical protein
LERQGGLRPQGCELAAVFEKNFSENAGDASLEIKPAGPKHPT